MKIVVVADDLSGAAELAGTAAARGLSSWVARRPPWPEECEVLCVDTQTRDLPAQVAARRVEEVARSFGHRSGVRFYKKVDSVLRGPVLAELDAMRRALGRPGAVLLPANPSRGRVIRNGHYFIQDVPLDRTEFARDPRHPRETSEVLELLGRGGEVPVFVCRPGDRRPEEGIVIAEAASAADVTAWAEWWKEPILAAGGADFFRALLDRWLGLPGETGGTGGSSAGSVAGSRKPEPGSSAGLRMFLVSGTASAQAREWREVSERAGVPVFCLFEEGTRFESGSDREKKVAMCAAGLVRIGRAVLCLGQPPAEGTSPVDPGVWLRPLARAAGSVWRESVPNLVLVEGGATAAALLEDFPWGAWRAVREWAPGVVELRAPQADTPAVIVKPGSYPWPDSIRELWFAGRRL